MTSAVNASQNKCVLTIDCVPHRRLLSKLKSYKLHTSIIEWIKNFLSDRKQRVRVDGEFSCWANVLSGIPQGSILGPLLFIIFINDMVDSCEYYLKLYLFADDAKMYCHIEDVSDMDNLQRGIDNFAKWTEGWQVKLNINKCKVISVYHRRYTDSGLIPNYVINNINLDEVDEIKDLGVTYDSLLLFDKHISEKVNKAYTMLGIIKRNFTHISRKCFVILYKSLVRFIHSFIIRLFDMASQNAGHTVHNNTIDNKTMKYKKYKI